VSVDPSNQQNRPPNPLSQLRSSSSAARCPNGHKKFRFSHKIPAARAPGDFLGKNRAFFEKSAKKILSAIFSYKKRDLRA